MIQHEPGLEEVFLVFGGEVVLVGQQFAESRQVVHDRVRLDGLSLTHISQLLVDELDPQVKVYRF